MKITELKKRIEEGGLECARDLYRDLDAARERVLAAIRTFTELFGEDREVMLLSVPGRSEILGNHTDHNGGKVLAGAIDRDIIAVVSPTEDGRVRLKSEGYPMDEVSLADTEDPEKFKDFSSVALIAGVIDGVRKNGYRVGGFDAYTTSDVLKGSGISSSAAYEVMIGNILNHLYNGGSIDNVEIAKIAMYSENVFFGKPSGLMDQMACAVGGFVFIDFADKASPVIEPLSFSLSDAGYELCIINTGGNHADLNDDYASVPKEMRAVAAILGRDILSGTEECEIIARAGEIRERAGDRALLRAIHFVRECERVSRAARALREGRLADFFGEVSASGHSSFEYLQNVYTVKNVSEQGLSVALMLADGFGRENIGAYRVHGGGFAGTIQAYVRKEAIDKFEALVNSVLGEGALMRLSVRPRGAVRVL